MSWRWTLEPLDPDDPPALSADERERLAELAPALRVGIKPSHRDVLEAMAAVARQHGYLFDKHERHGMWMAELNGPGADLQIVGSTNEHDEERVDVQIADHTLLVQVVTEVARRCGPMLVGCDYEFELVLPPEDTPIRRR